MTENKEQSSETPGFIKLFRFERTVMAAIITGSAAFAAGSGISHALLLALAGWYVAVGGFSLDRVTRLFSLFFIAAGILVTFLVNAGSLIPLAVILVLVIATALAIFTRPLVRTLILGLLHALHLLMGSMVGELNLPVIMLAAVLFFAIVGARGIIDIRNWEQDMMSGKKTLVTLFKLSGTVKLSIVCFLLAYAALIGTYFVGQFRLLYLYPAVILALAGIVCIFLFVKKAGPAMARKLTPFFTTATVFLVCLAMVLGSL